MSSQHLPLGTTEATEKDPLKDLRLPITCPNCSWHRGKVITLDSGPHAAKLECSACGRWIKWLSKKKLEQIVLAASEGLSGGAE
ncbi:MAG: hypothetical protein AAGC93_23195 [Cyanobacteria bacterium P01_F01_bin.53]